MGCLPNRARYDAVVRFSNGSGQNQDDDARDARGMALKVHGGAESVESGAPVKA